MDAFTIRLAVFLDYAENTNGIFPLRLRCDPGNHFVPIWTKFVTLQDGRIFEFVREAHNKAKTGIYKPSTNIYHKEEPITELTQSELVAEVEGLEEVIISHEQFIEFLAKKISNLEGDRNNFNEILNRELNLFYEEKNTEKVQTEE